MPKQPKYFNSPTGTLGSINFQALQQGQGGSPALAQQAFEWNQKGVTCSSRDDWVSAEKWHRKALEAKLTCRLNPVTVGVSYNSLGESLLENGKFEEAEEKLKKALEIRKDLGRGHLFDTAVTRENLAQLYQAMGKPTEANQARLAGEATGEMCCSNYRCQEQELPRNRLSQCSQCRLSWYCSKACQKIDWNKRHKAQCQKLKAALAEEESS